MGVHILVLTSWTGRLSAHLQGDFVSDGPKRLRQGKRSTNGSVILPA
jgi:hypothetical protein